MSIQETDICPFPRAEPGSIESQCNSERKDLAKKIVFELEKILKPGAGANNLSLGQRIKKLQKQLNNGN